MDGVGISARLLAKQCDIRSFVFSIEKSLPRPNDTLRGAIFDIQAFEFDFVYKNIEFSSLLFSFEECNFYLFFYLFLW